MDIKTLTDFFMWCSVMNGGLLLFWTAWLVFAPDLVYRIQSRFVPISRENFNTTMYNLLGQMKLLFIMFFLMPYLALLIIA